MGQCWQGAKGKSSCVSMKKDHPRLKNTEAGLLMTSAEVFISEHCVLPSSRGPHADVIFKPCQTEYSPGALRYSKMAQGRPSDCKTWLSSALGVIAFNSDGGNLVERFYA